MNWRIYITAGLMWAVVLGVTAEAGNMKYLLSCYSNDNMSAATFNTWNSYVLANGRWMPMPSNEWYIGNGVTEHTLDDGVTYYVNFLRIRNFYVPEVEAHAVPPNLGYTNWYYIYSNSLSVVVTGIVGGASAVWRLSSYPANEYTNSSTYSTYGTVFTNSSPSYSYTLSTIPTGTYSISFNALRGHYMHSPPATNITITGAAYDWFSTNAYQYYTNGLSVVISGVTGTNVVWTLSSYPNEYTNALSTGTTFTNTYTITPIPTGSYAVTFPSLTGYTTPAAVTSAVADGTNTVTGTYSCVNGHLRVNMSPDSVTSSAPWTMTGYPSGYTNGIYSGTGPQTISNVIIGSYTITFGDVTGYTTPSAQSGTVASNALTTILGTYTFAGYTLTVVISAPLNRQQSLGGIGSGPLRIEYNSGTISTQTASEAVYSVFSDSTVTLTALTNFVYRWYYNNAGSINPPTGSTPFTNTYSFNMNGVKTVWLLYSQPYNSYDNAGDIDQDQLPDRWEAEWFPPSSWISESVYPQAEVSTNTYANGDDDFIPSSGTNAPMQISISTNIISYSGTNGLTPGYPLQRNRLLSRQEAPSAASTIGYATGTKFHNLLECRGLDGCYLTNGTSGWVPNDDPLTDPTKSDTDNDGMTDGWEYYFWYWRSASAYSAGLSNSANLSWVTIRPNVWDMSDNDMDGDGFQDLEEHDDTWTDPTHCDTDADSMDDYWEINNITVGAIANSNALDYANSWHNPDSDFMARVTNTMLTVGRQGTMLSLGTNVCYVGDSNSPRAAWVDQNRDNIFNLYTDIVLRATSLTNLEAGTAYSATNYYGTNASMGSYKSGYPVWVDMDDSGTYSTGDVAIVNPDIKHDGVYCLAPSDLASRGAYANYPGVCSFNPYTAWTNPISISSTNGSVTFTASGAAPDTAPYTTYQEYLGADLIGRLSWDAAGLMSSINDSEFALNRNSYSDPQNQDTDSDLMPDGWELYTGLNDNNASDAGTDSDDDALNNFSEWANATHPLGSCASTWPLKPLPTDPGIITPPQPNDPHPRDTDWDGVTDGGEKTLLSNPCAWDTDGDHLPDSWEWYAGTSFMTNDASADLDGDGLLNWQEYWCGTVPEWMLINPAWQTVYFCVRRAMTWDPFSDPAWGRAGAVFIPPDYISDPCFMYVNSVYTDLGYLRTNYPAANAWSAPSDPLTVPYYHTPFANNADSDGDNMDDFWEVYHGLNPCRGVLCLTIDYVPRSILFGNVALPDADPTTPGYQFGPEGAPFNSLLEYVQFVEPFRNNPDSRGAMLALVGPFNLGLNGMDPDGDGLPNLEEYSYSSGRAFYHTDPTPDWRTARFSFINYTFDMAPDNFLEDWGIDRHTFSSPFKFEVVEGYDTDNDGVSDYAEINSAAGQTGNNPLDERNPVRNRALYLNGTNDFARQVSSRGSLSESTLTRFCVEAWIKPDNPTNSTQVVFEKAGLYGDPFNPGHTNVGANFRMGITNGLPFVLYNGRGSLRTYQATAQTRHRITSNTNWTHIAGSYDGTNLTIYVNGEESYSLRTTELPANGYNILLPGGTVLGTPHMLMVGACDTNAGVSMFTAYPSPSNYFGGCIDEVRVWDGTRTRAEILANKNRRLTQSDITNAMPSIYNYWTFDDVPDPNRPGETIFPSGMDGISSDMHPSISWWQNYTMHSTVYTGVTNSYNYVVYASDHAWHSRATSPAYDDYYHFSTNFNTNAVGTNVVQTPAGYVNPGNPYHQSWLNDNYIYDILLFRGTRAVATNSWLSSLDPGNPDSTDSDGDGMPDWWEQQYGLDPNDAAGVNGAWGDYDNDGLNNYAEYRAGTDPRNSDTNGDGIGDYDSRPGPYQRTYGEMYMDGDGMPDDWEMDYGLDPYHYDAHLDNDNDGWSNYAEYQGGTAPNDATSYPQPHVWGSADYFGDKSGTFTFYAYSTNTMDGEPMTTQIGAGQSVAETIGQTDGTLYFSGRLPLYPLDVTTIVRISAPYGTNNTMVTFTFTGPDTYTYSGSGSDYSATLNYTTGRLNLRWASTELPATGADVSVDYTYVNRNAAAFDLTGFKEGDFYLLAALDASTMGIMEDQPLYLSPSSLFNVKVHVKDSAPGYGRFAWTASSASTTDYPVVINKISSSGSPTVMTRSMRYPRNYIHEWDYQLAGHYGLGAGSYQWWMNGQHGTFTVSWPSSVNTPSLVSPRGDELYQARNQFKWTMDAKSTKYHLQVAKQSATGGGLSFVIDQYYPLPYCDANGIYQAYLPKYAGELGNGIYYWRVAGWSPAGESSWSDAQTFKVNLNATNSHWIAGDIYYFGKADSSNIIVEVFDNPGFGGKPEARILLAGASRTNSNKGSYTLRGLEAGTYYVRAYLDVTPAGGTRSDKLDRPWESWGFIRNPTNDYVPRSISLANTLFFDGTRIVIRDQDTDNDLLPDAWEMYYFGNLDQTGDMDYDGDGETNLEEYMRDGYDMNPAAWDTDGDGLSDWFEMNYTAPSFGYSAKSGSQLNPNVWDTDGDGYSDGAELKRYHTDPLSSASYPPYQPMCFDAAASPADYDGDGRTDLGVYDVSSGNWHIMSAYGQSFSLAFGNPATQPMLGDYDGDGCGDFALYDPVSGTWYLYNAWTDQSFRLNFGDSEMIPVPADYDGDGKTDLAVYYPAEGMWYIYSVWTSQLYTFQFGGASMTPVPGDYNGDGGADLAVYEPATGDWNIFAFHLYTHVGTYYSGTFGGPTCVPAAGDYDGDGRNDAALFEQSTGNWYILTWRGQFFSSQFGGYGCIPASGDYDGDGRTDLCVYYPPTGMWYIYCWSGQSYQAQLGWPSAVPIMKGRM